LLATIRLYYLQTPQIIIGILPAAYKPATARFVSSATLFAFIRVFEFLNGISSRVTRNDFNEFHGLLSTTFRVATHQVA
jgi:hypothetical protein